MGRLLSLSLGAFIITTWVLPASAFTPAARARGSTVLNVLNYGAKPNDSYDDTVAIQKAINALPSTGGTVYIPAGTYRINADDSTNQIYRGLNLRSLMHLQLDANAILKTIPNDSMSSFYVLNVHQVADVEISGGQIIGERTQHIDIRTDKVNQKSEWGHGIMVRGSSRVTIRNMTIKDNWGDGISIGAQGEDFSNDVIVDNVISTNNRRQGLTIGRSLYVKVYDSEFAKTNGAKPAYGIDIEPDPFDGAYAKAPRIENCFIHDNEGGGIQIYHLVQDSIIKGNVISFNQYGVYAVEAQGGSITGNTLKHNRYQGVYLGGGSANMSISGNTFRNNSTVAVGYNTTSSVVTYSGFSSNTHSTTRTHVKNNSGNSTNGFGTNYYAK